MNSQLLHDIDQSIKVNQDSIEFGLTLDRLKLNRDFKRVVLDGYLSQEAVRLVHLKASPDYQSPEAQRLLLAQIDSIGCFYQYLNRIGVAAEIARKSLQSDEQTREEVLSEER